jgi:hypothetical protein
MYIVSDDATCIFKVSIKDNNFRRICLSDFSSSIYRIEKNAKPDFEAATPTTVNGAECILAVGSGSKKGIREKFLIVNQNNDSISGGDLTKLYHHLRTITGSPEALWNIEGLTIINNNIVFLNRGNNLVMSFPWPGFLKYINANKNTDLSMDFYKLSLPEIDGHEARFSGICKVDDRIAIASASVEDTPDAYQDGPVLGSYVFLLDMHEKKILSHHLLADASGKPLRDKIESVDFIQKVSNGMLEIIAICDNDDGKTKYFKLRIPAADN